MTPEFIVFYYDGTGLDSVPSYSLGKTTKISSSVSETKNLTFDIMGRVLTNRQITDGVTYGFGYTYNLAGALVQETYPSGRVVKSELDADGALSRVSSTPYGSTERTYATAFSYNASGAVEKMRLGNGKWETTEFNERQQIKMIGLGNGSNDTSLLRLDFTYTSSGGHDNNGSMRSQTITVPTVGANAGFVATQVYTYDALNRIGSATETIAGVSGNTWKQTFTYDQYGNRRFDTSGSNTTTLGSCSTAECNPTVSTSSNRLTSSGYSYDANGSLAADALGERFGYDQEGRQNAFFIPSNSGATPDATYYFDGEGKRVKKISSTETTIFVYDAGGVLSAEYSTALATTPQVSYLTDDQVGSPRIITNQLGAVTSRKDFAAFGDETITSQRITGLGYSAPNVRQDYTGYEKDAESSLEYAQARYYNPQHGRFTSVDPMSSSATIRNPQTFNRYSYVLNSPYKFTDPLGLFHGVCNSHRCVGVANSDDWTISPVENPAARSSLGLTRSQTAAFVSYMHKILSPPAAGGDVTGMTLLVSGPNHVTGKDADNREGVENATLGTKTTVDGGYYLLNVQVAFTSKDKMKGYRSLRVAIILATPAGGKLGVRRGENENPDEKGQARSEGVFKFITDAPGSNVSGGPRAEKMANEQYRAIFFEAEYNKKDEQLASVGIFYEVNLAFDGDGAVIPNRSSAFTITSAAFIKAAGSYMDNYTKTVNKVKMPCAECMFAK